jgi:triacylglycerol esterase/lipase EstA (alpha/beta hydrolase family)
MPIRRAVAALTVLAALVAAAPASAAEPLPPQGSSPPGANDFSCKPPARHPYPVVLVHGTFGNMGVSWNSIAPDLERLGYCVFALDYGNSQLQGVNGVGDIPTSARQLATFVDEVLSKTGAAKVSFVGHSQGGMLPRYWIEFLGGAGKVDDVVGLSPSNHGTTSPLAGPAGPLGCPACAQQVAGSDFMNQLNAGDQTPPPGTYTVIETRNDEVVTPYQSEFLAAGDRVTNILLQDKCPADPTDHVGIIYDPVAIQWMLSALGRPGPADPGFTPDCTGQSVSSFPDSSSVPAGGSAGGQGETTRTTRLVFGHSFSHTRATGGRRMRIALTARGGKVSGVVVTLRTRAGKLAGRSKATTIAHRRGVTIVLKRPLPRGTYTARASGRNAAGKAVTASRKLTLR